MPRAVLDPNVLISVLIAPRGARPRILLELRDGAFELIASPALLAELRTVLMRDKFRQYASVDEVGAFVELIRVEGALIEDPEPSGVGVTDDPGDEYLVALARAARTDVLVSGDPDLLKLRARIPVRSPREFLDSLGG